MNLNILPTSTSWLYMQSVGSDRYETSLRKQELPLPELQIKIDELEPDEWLCAGASASDTHDVVKLTVHVEEEVVRSNGDVPYVLTAQCDREMTVISPPGPGVGCTFVFVPSSREVKDFRLYIRPMYRGQGFGSLVVQFVKAYFFPHYLEGRLRLPVGGILVPAPRRITVLPSKKALSFYKRHGFQNRQHESKMFYLSPQFSRAR